jgi:hypothetical protein
VSAPSIPDVIRENQSRFTASTTDVKDNTVIDTDETVTEYTATEVGGEEFDVLGALAAIAMGGAEFRSNDEESQAVLDGMEHAFQAGALFAHLFAEEIEDDPELVKMGYQTYLLAQMRMAGQL